MVEAERLDTTETLLLLQAGDRQVAVPLSLVARLEEFPRDRIEVADGHPAVQYRGSIMPLVDTAEQLGVRSVKSDEDTSIHVVVYTSNDRSIGLTVDAILDIVREQVAVDQVSHGSGIRGSIVVQGKITDIVDVIELIGRVDETFFQGSSDEDELVEVGA
jgi:two-component system chemotaxis sensor kinase CheA